ncbi:MAG: ribonucleoside-diphosphate reductase, adenosylcobalamin-dependent [Firmicutes bacterium HGW-Firmicutes-12]|nr:MAG: ribonucleoside-diphosphate reductase, adenosylcobalamin-dependent [Firmicutes bacterium HGW-Firmicutes-12]
MNFNEKAPKEWPKMQLSSTARVILEKRYLKQEDGQVVETPEDMLYRVAFVVADIEKKFGTLPEEVQRLTQDFYNMMANLEFMPNSPTLMNAGRELGQLSACFVLPIEDSMEDIFDAIKYAAIIHKSGGGTGFSFSRLRAKNSSVRSTGGVASGPVSFMKVFNAATEAVKQGGTRRGANMGILRVDHPDILEFIHCKENNQDITNFNISVGITAEFMEALSVQGNYDLVDPHTKRVIGQLSAADVFEQIVDSAWSNGEPGLIFLESMNQGNPTPQLGEIEATNPCGEQPLLPNEACNLGSINLKVMVTERNGEAVINWERLAQVTRLAVRFLDDVIEANQYPIPLIEEMVKGNRKIGLGVMGFADMLIKLQISYASEDAVLCAQKVMRFIQTEGRLESERLANERGVFPNYPGSIYDGVRKLRNATVTTIAPTGTISMICGASSGVEPIFAVAYTKTVLDGTSFVEVNPLFEQYAQQFEFSSNNLTQIIARTGSAQGLVEVPDWVQDIFITAQEIAPEWHIRIQAAFQQYTDNAVSKTINFANNATREDIAQAYLLAHELDCKGLTVYRDGSRTEQVISVGAAQGGKEQEKGHAAGYNTIVPRPRPEVTMGVTEKIKIGCGNLYVSVNADEEGICEVFTNTGRAGGCSSQSEATARLISIALRSGIEVETLIEQMRGIRCPACVRREGVKVTSCPDAISRVIQKYMDIGVADEERRLSPQVLRKLSSVGVKSSKPTKNNPVNGLTEKVIAGEDNDNACPECGLPINHESGCIVCIHCGYSKCG